MAHTHTEHRTVAFSETDMGGIVHFSQFARYVEDTEHAMFRSEGLSIAGPLPDGTQVGWPRVSYTCDFSGPLRFEDTFAVTLTVEHVGNKSIRYGFVVERFDGDQRHKAASGTMATACVQSDAEGTMRAVPIPDLVRERITAAPNA